MARQIEASMKNLLSFLCVIGVVAITAGCTTGSATRTSATLYQPTASSSVEILFEKPARPYKVIGQVSSRGAALASEDAMYRAMQKEGAELGAHAILITSNGIQDVPQWGAENYQKARALAIRWTDGKADDQAYAVTPTSTQPTTPKETQVIPRGAGRR